MKLLSAFALGVTIPTTAILILVFHRPELDTRNRWSFWNSESLQRELDMFGYQAKVCYCIKNGQVHCVMHAWMNDEEQAAVAQAPPPAAFLKSFHRPIIVGAGPSDLAPTSEFEGFSGSQPDR